MTADTVACHDEDEEAHSNDCVAKAMANLHVVSDVAPRLRKPMPVCSNYATSLACVAPVGGHQ